jgi:hypothetical protein
LFGSLNVKEVGGQSCSSSVRSVRARQNRTAVLLLYDWWKRTCVATGRDSYIQFIRGMYQDGCRIENNYSAPPSK